MRRRLGVRRAAGATALTVTSTALAAALAIASPPVQPPDHGAPSTTPASQVAPPGRSGTTPGQTDTTPGQSGATAPGPPATAPGLSGTAPGVSGTAPGQAGTTPALAATPRGGEVTVALPGSRASVPLTAGMKLPTGTVVDATKGSVQLPSPNGASPGVFKGGRFVVRQTGGANPRTDLRLTGGDFAACPKPLAAAPAAVIRSALIATAASRSLGRHAVVRRLWGHDHHGRFSTSGRYAAAVVRGTTWLTEDRCDGTRVAVTQGAVAVRDTRRHRTVIVRAGHSYLVKR